MGLFNRIKGLFGRQDPTGVSYNNEGTPRGGFWQRVGDGLKQRRIDRQWKKSQERMEKMERESLRDKMRRKAEEAAQKKAYEERMRAAHEQGRQSFQEHYGFNDRQYDDFIQFIDGTGEDLKEAFGSENLVEAFRTGREYGLSPEDMRAVLDQTYNMTEGGTQEDIINDLYANMAAYAGNVKEGSYV